MLKWCSYCQQFQGEAAPYADFTITHGLCRACGGDQPILPSGIAVDRAKFLHAIFQSLFEAGRRNDFPAAETIVGRAIAANCRPVDVLVGMIAPMLHEIGEAWERGSLSVAGEHEFTAFSERVIDLVEARMNGHARVSGNGDVVLMNAPGNTHTLAIRILALWLQARGVPARTVDERALFGALTGAPGRPKTLLISMALPEQRDGVAHLIERLQNLPEPSRPRILIGGFAVKTGLTAPIAGSELVADIGELDWLTA